MTLFQAVADRARSSVASRLAFALCTVLLATLTPGCGDPAPARELWLYDATNLADDARVARLESIWRRAKAAGYSRVVLADTKLARLSEMDPGYFANLARVRGLARELGLEIIPAVFPIGRSNSLIARRPDLAEALPIRNALFEVHGGAARLVPDPPVGFGDRPAIMDPGVTLANGTASLQSTGRRTRFMYRVRIARFRSYHVSVRIRTRDFTGTPIVEALASGRPIHFTRSLGVARTQDWTTHHIAFDSLDHDQVEIWFGVWERASGLLEWRDWRIEETGPFNVVRRRGAPFVVAGFVEGRDFEPVRDSLLGCTPWPGQFDEWHEPIPIRTRLHEGARFRASWYQAAVVLGGQVNGCVSEPALDSLLRDQATRVRSAFGARSYLLMIDEVRAMNWDESCRGRGLAPGQLLAREVRSCAALLPDARLYVWNDMFDPHQNAIRDYYLVNGDLAGSWEGLPNEMGVVNWNSGHRDESLRFFADRRHPQVIAGYYDGRPEQIRDWLRSAARVPGVIAVMYTTWRDDYDDLERFARICRNLR